MIAENLTPEFYPGKNFMDFYDSDIEAKLKALEEKKINCLRWKETKNILMEDDKDDENFDGVTKVDFKSALKDVRSKKAIVNMQHKLNKNLRIVQE